MRRPQLLAPKLPDQTPTCPPPERSAALVRRQNRSPDFYNPAVAEIALRRHYRGRGHSDRRYVPSEHRLRDRAGMTPRGNLSRNRIMC